MNENNSTNNLSLERATFDFLNELSKIAKIDKAKDTVKLVIYNRKDMDIITFTHNDYQFTDNISLISQNENKPNEFVVITNDEQKIKYNCRLFSQDHVNEIFFFLMKPEIDNNTGDNNND
jgi:uncharacterized UPF0160 family protein